MGRWHPDSKSATSSENIICRGLEIRAKSPFEIILAYGETPLPKECHIRNISFSDILSFSQVGAVIHGFAEEHIDNVSLNNITMNCKNSEPLSIKYADHLDINNLKIS